MIEEEVWNIIQRDLSDFGHGYEYTAATYLSLKIMRTAHTRVKEGILEIEMDFPYDRGDQVLEEFYQ